MTLRELAENAVGACLPLLPLEGSDAGYKVAREIHPDLLATVQEWAEAAYAIAELHAELRASRLDASTESELAREALRQVVEHWPGDLRGVSLRVELHASMDDYVRVTLLSSSAPLGRLLRFTADELRHGSPAVGQRVRREHHEWTEGR